VSAGRTRARWGWHRLTDDAAFQLVDEAGIRARDLVVDVGAGTGTITAALVERGARVVAVELHPKRAQVLRDRFRHAPVIVVQADASDLRLPRRAFRVVANPPFGVTSALLRRLLVPANQMLSADLVLSRHAATRWISAGAANEHRWTSTFAVDIAHSLSRSAFVPRPTVDSVVLHIERLQRPERSGRAGIRSRTY
jgi:23S rRNA (adenine-N6)-dimethyltransferase